MLMTMGGDGHGALVGHGGQPGRPAAFRAAGDDEALDRAVPLRLGQRLDGVHGPHRAFDHGELQDPRRVAGGEVAEPRFGDQVVLLVVAQQRLIGDLVEHGHAGLGQRGQREAGPVGVLLGPAADAPAADQQDGVVGKAELPRLEHQQGVPPDDPLPLLVTRVRRPRPGPPPDPPWSEPARRTRGRLGSRSPEGPRESCLRPERRERMES